MAVGSGRGIVESELRRYAELTRARIRDELASGEVSEYLAGPMGDYPERGGKGIRPTLLLATCQAFGGLLVDGLPSAVAIEMLHNAFLIHDDIEDGSVLRRGLPTLHEKVGLAMAIHAGDALAMRGVGALRANRELLGQKLAADVFDEFEFMSRHTSDGQAIDLAWRDENRLDLTPTDYLDLMMKKTSWYTTVLPLRVGAMIGSRGSADLKPMIDFGFFLGAAFQIQDDVLNLTADAGKYGKEQYGDVREGKRTLTVIHVAAVAESDEREWLASVLAPERDRSPQDVAAVIALMERHGSISFAREFARGVASSAHDAFELAFADTPQSHHRELIEELIPYMVDRLS